MIKVLFIILGTISLILGIIGIFLPILPTTPFLLLTATLYVRSSERLYRWLISQKYLGTYILHFREHRAIPMKAKVISILMIWGTMLYCVIALLPQWWLKVLFIVIAICITLYLLYFKTLGQDG